MTNAIIKLVIFLIITTSSFSVYEDEINSLFGDENIEHSSSLVIDQEVKVDAIDPILLKDTYSRRAMNYIYAQLFQVNKSGEVAPYLLEEYRRNDEMELYCKLRDDAYFSNGDPVTSREVKESIENYLENGYMNNLYSSIKRVEILNDKEFLILLNYPDSEIEIELSNPLMSILKRVDDKIVTSGRYAIEEFGNNTLKLKRNEYYFEKNVPFETLEIKGELSSYQRVINSLNLPNYFSYDLYEEDIDTARRIGDLQEKEIIEDTVFDIVSLVFVNKKNYTL